MTFGYAVRLPWCRLRWAACGLLCALVWFSIPFASGGAQEILPRPGDEVRVDAGPVMPVTIDFAALAALERQYPGVRHLRDGDTVAIYGKPMTAAATPEEAAASWLSRYGTVLGVRTEELVPHFEAAVRFGKFMVYGYRQSLEGTPVAGSVVRVLVLGGEPWRVVYAASRGCTRPPAIGFARVRVPATAATDSVQALGEYADLDQWKVPTLAVLRAEGGNAARRVWQFSGRNSDRRRQRSFRFRVDATSGALVSAESRICYTEVDGTISGLATPGVEADTTDNGPEEVVLVGVDVDVDGEVTQTGDDGTYLVGDLIDGDEVTVEVELTGDWVRVFHDEGAEESLDDTVEVPGSVDLIFNEDSEEFVTAQVNAFIHTQGTHDFFTDRAPDFDEIDSDIACYVNIDSNCNAFFDDFDLSINFFSSGADAFGDCNNTAFSSVISHEYAHFVVDKLRLTQGAFGEGYADAMANLYVDDPVVGESFFTDGGIVRDSDTSDRMYPCTGPLIHFCGQVLAGTWWDLRVGLEDELDDSEESLEEVRQLFVDWSLITVGADDGNSAGPLTARQVLTVDDDDGDIDNGTPRRTVICDAFGEHGIDCPELLPIAFVFADGIPTLLSPDGSTTFSVEVIAVADEPEDGTGLLFYSTNGAPFEEVELTATSEPNVYTVEVPVDECLDQIDFYLSAEDSGFDTTTAPSSAPDQIFIAVVGTGTEVVLADDFEEDLDWTAGLASDDATTGEWVRVEPVETIAQPGDDHSEDGTFCYVTGQGSVGGLDGEADIDGGDTTLLSPLLDLSAEGAYYISYWRWYDNASGAAPGADEFVVDISNDDGGLWEEVEVVGPGGAEASGGWFFHRFRVSDFVSPTDEVLVRFIAEDGAEPSLVEAAIDDFLVERVLCDEVEGEDFSRGDCNADGSRDISDPITLLLYLFGIGDVTLSCEHACDANDDGALALTDVFSILDAIFEGDTLEAPFPGCGGDTDFDVLTCETATDGCTAP